jgi:hypothetical protein
MTEEQLIELWGDGSDFGLSPQDELFMNSAFREVAMRFAQRVAEIAYERGYEQGGMDNGGYF